MEQVSLVNQQGQSVMLSRIKDRDGTWLGFKQVHSKLFSSQPRQSFKNTLARSADLRSRNATEVEKDFLKASGAIISRSNQILLLHLDEVCSAARRSGFSITVVDALAELATKSAYTEELVLQEAVAAAAQLQISANEGENSSLSLCVSQLIGFET